jgi:hypothetical protein
LITLSSSCLAGEAADVDRDISKAIDDLLSPTVEQQRAAEKTLRRYDEEAVSALRKASEGALSEKATARLMKALRYCAPGGTSINGVSVYFECNKKTMAVGDTVRFTATIRNKSDEESNIKVVFPKANSIAGSIWVIDGKDVISSPRTRKSDEDLPKDRTMLFSLGARESKTFDVSATLIQRPGEFLLRFDGGNLFHLVQTGTTSIFQVTLESGNGSQPMYSNTISLEFPLSTSKQER